MSVVRWTLYDPSASETYTFAINPSEGGTPSKQKTITDQSRTAPGSKPLLFEGSRAVERIECSGTILDQAQLSAFFHWFDKPRQVRLTDDLGRQFWVYIEAFDATRKRARSHQWKHTYSLKMLVLDW